MAISVKVQYNGGLFPDDTVNPMLLPLENPIKCNEEILSLQPMIPPKRFDIFFPDWGRMLRKSRCVQMFLQTTLLVTCRIT